MAAVMAEMANTGHAPLPDVPLPALRVDPMRVAQVHRAVAEATERPAWQEWRDRSSFVRTGGSHRRPQCRNRRGIGADRCRQRTHAQPAAGRFLGGDWASDLQCPQDCHIRSTGSEIASATVAVALARVLSLRGDACILLDSEGRTDSLLRVLRIAPASGFGELLRGKASFREACRKDPLSKLDVVQAGHPPVGSDVIRGPLTAGIMEMLERHYSFVIVHAAAPAQGAEPWKNFHAGLAVASAERAAEAGSIVKAMRAAGVASAQYLRLSAPAEPSKIGKDHATKNEGRQQSGKEASCPGAHQQPAPWLS